VLGALDADNFIHVARAFSQFINLTNIAEQAQAAEDRKVPFPEESELLQLMHHFDGKIDREKLVSAITNVSCELLLTAHPTEITRRTLIQKYNRIADQLGKVDSDQPLSPNDRTELERLIAEVWHTDEISHDKPTPQDEAKWGFAVVENAFWHAIPVVWKGLDQLLTKHTGQGLPITSTPIKISSWMGGDLVDNPEVTAEVTQEVIRLARWMAADLFLRDIEELLSQLSMSHCNQEVANLSDHDVQEPYRAILRRVRARLIATKDWSVTDSLPNPAVLLSNEDLFEPLFACYQSLHESGMGIIADGLLKDTLIRISTLGVTLVNMDIKQDSSKHTELLNELTQYLEVGSYIEWSEKARQDFIVGELESKRPLIPARWILSNSAWDTLQVFQLIASEGVSAISSYVLANAKHPTDILAVVLLLNKCGLEEVLPVVPLFESLEDLESAAWTLERLLRISWYTNYINGHQQVMIGYSDSAKDGGQMAAAWAQFKAQEELVAVAEKYGIKLTILHGRGGTVGRGGAPTRAAILSQPAGSVRNSIRLTEQGEVIRFKYGSAPLAIKNLDIILSSTIEASITSPPTPRDNWRGLMDRLSETAASSYKESIQENNLFVDYFEQSTPENELSSLALGDVNSEHRTKRRSIEELRAIPWVFAWTQKRLMIPAWLGSDAAFNQQFTGKDSHTLKEMIEEWPFFQSYLGMLEMVLSKADIEISEDYDSSLVDESLQTIGRDFHSRLAQLIESINKLKGQSSLLEKHPEIQRTIDLRNPYTDPLHFLQIELLTRSRKAGQAELEKINKALLVTIAGIAASMRNTG
jgi:phosphoenolpyruvate carboxylase